MFYFRVKKLGLFLSSLFLVLLMTSCANQRTILTNVDERDANQIIVLLESKGIVAQKTLVKSSGAAAQSTENMWDITVDHHKAIEALAILNKIGLPRKQGLSILELFPSQGMMKTESEEQIRYIEGLNEQLANTLRKIDGILDVQVQISMPVVDAFNPDAAKEYPRASVFVKHDGILDDPNNLYVQKIRRYISGSVTDLSYDDVTVVTDRARFTDINLRSLEPKSAATPWGNQDFVKIWSIVVSNDSAGAFRTILFLFCFFLLILILAFAWCVWKFQGVFKQIKSFKSFFSATPMNITVSDQEGFNTHLKEEANEKEKPEQ